MADVQIWLQQIKLKNQTSLDTQGCEMDVGQPQSRCFSAHYRPSSRGPGSLSNNFFSSLKRELEE